MALKIRLWRGSVSAEAMMPSLLCAQRVRREARVERKRKGIFPGGDGREMV